MEEMHRIHKDVPYGYWVLWVEPAWRHLTRKWRERRRETPRKAPRRTLPKTSIYEWIAMR
jgi:hypothetical protein